MNTPEWFGTIGVMNSAHLHRRGAAALLRRAMCELRAVAACLRFWRSPRPSSGRAARPRPRRERGVLAQQVARSF